MSDVIHEIDVEALDALIERLNEAKQYDLTLSPEDIQLLLTALATLTTLQARLSDKGVTIHKLRKLLGMVAASEQLSALLGNPSSAGSKPQKLRKKNNHGSDQAQVKPKVIHHPLAGLKKGDRCPSCLTGTLSKYEPAVLLRITGHSPYEAVKHVSERLRCNACGQYFTATLPMEVIVDGDANQKYGYSARSLMAISKYFMGSPFFRQQTLQAVLGMPITASTVFDQCEKTADAVFPLYKTLIKEGANAVHFYLDDTTHRILDQKSIIKKQRHSNKEQTRTGTYASGLIATLASGQDIVLFQTNIGHGGEWIDEILLKRDPGQAPPILMSDALSCNKPSTVAVTHALCNSHARRQFVDVLTQFPKEVEYVLNLYKAIWTHDKTTKEQGLSNAKRLAYHREHSLPVMETIRDYARTQLDQEHVEAHSGLGKAMSYFLNHFTGLTCFCTVEGAMLDNNVMEAQLKMIVRGRKNWSFYKTLAGAAISDILTSVIATCVRAQVNPFDYLNAIQRHHDAAKTNPQAWLPWNYQLNLCANRLAQAARA
jgi:hypothetical protein